MFSSMMLRQPISILKQKSFPTTLICSPNSLYVSFKFTIYGLFEAAFYHLSIKIHTQ